MLAMLHFPHDSLLRRCVTFESIGHDHPWHEALFLQQFAYEPLCRLRVLDVVAARHLDCDYHLIEMQG